MRNISIVIILAVLSLLPAKMSSAWTFSVDGALGTKTDYPRCQKYADNVVSLVQFYVELVNAGEHQKAEEVKEEIKKQKKKLKRCEEKRKTKPTGGGTVTIGWTF